MESFSKILIVQPSWVGDAVMATPMLRAFRQRFPSAHISYLLRRYVKGIYTGMPWADQLITYRTGKGRSKTGKGVIDLAARLRGGNFNLAVLLPNSFKTALVCKMAGIDRILGYERDGRSFLLTDRLLPTKDGGKFVPTPMVGTYLGLARYFGATGKDRRMGLFVTDAERRGADAVFARAGIDTAARPLVMLNPGAQFGAAKLWRADYFAAVADRFVSELGATVVISGSPKERPIVDLIRSQMKRPAIDLTTAGMTLGSLKEVVRRCDLMVTNDTGPRHIAAAMGTPVVTIFGPTDPAWTEIDFPAERQVMVKVFCGPCQKKICPLDHRCMTLATPDLVWNAAVELLRSRTAVQAGGYSPAAT